MLNKSETTRGNFSTPIFIATSLALLLILFIRTTRGLDLTDEMQYYGEIRGLIETGRLFSNDLFIQQSVYILLYPVFRLYHSIFGFEGLVFFGRLVMSILIAGVFAYAYQKLVALEFSKPVACLTALSLTFAIPYHGIFAPSYNTISQVLWIIFSIRFFEWKRGHALSWGAVPVIMVFSHPTSAVMMTLLIFARLLSKREFVRMGMLALVLFGGVLIAVPTAFHFALPQEYLASLHFSSGYGVGTAFISNQKQPITLVAIYAMFASCALASQVLGKYYFSIVTSYLSIPVVLCLSLAVNLFLGDYIQSGYEPRVVYVLSFLTALAYGWTLSSVPIADTQTRQSIHWLVIFILAFATTLGVTSGNGIGQSIGAFMVGLPLLLGLAVTRAAHAKILEGSSFIGFICAALVSILFLVHWSRFPYREVNWWSTRAPIGSVSAFAFISTSAERANFIYRVQQALGKTTQGKRTLIISDYPALYFALDTIPETCMLYMHSIGSDKSEKTLLECFERKSPQVIVDISPHKGLSSEGVRLETIMGNYIIGKGYDCDIGSMTFDSNGYYNPAEVKVTVCRHAMVSGLVLN